MALSRKLLESLGLESAKVETIIEAHGDTVTALKAQIDKYKEDAEKLTTVQSQLAEAQKELESFKGGDDWQKKYEDEHKAFEDYKTAQANKATLASKQSAYKALLKGSGISEQVIDELAELAKYDDISLDDKGNITDADKLSESIKSKYSKFIVHTTTQGTNTENPPANNNPTYTKEDIAKMSEAEINKNWEAIKASL